MAYRMMLLLSLLAPFAAFPDAATSGNEPDKKNILVLASAESHGMVDSCQCEVEPGGGVAKRMTLVNRLRSRDTVLLLDAGGFSAGGIYDEYTQGRARDSIRTFHMIKSMSMMSYDAVAIGDDDLQYGAAWLAATALQERLPLVCANCFRKDGSLIVAPYHIVSKNGVRTGITAVCTQERLFTADTSVVIDKPETSLDRIWKKLCDSTDVQIILAHTGEELGTKLIKRYPECDVLVNGHRKTDARAGAISGSSLLLNFGFQAKKLSGSTVTFDGKVPSFSSPVWYEVSGNLPPATAVTDFLTASAAQPAQKNAYDLYIMSQCPYGIEALMSITGFFADTMNTNVRVWFIGTVEEDSSMISLHGQAEMDDEKYWLAMQALYPEWYREFIKMRSKGDKTSRECAATLKADLTKVDNWVTVNGNVELRLHYLRSMRQGIEGSPTLLVNNQPFTKKITSVNLYRIECEGSARGNKVCTSLPECVEDIDCSAKGKIGTCGNSGKCQFTDDSSFVFTVITAPHTIQHPEITTMQTTRELFPAATIQEFTIDSKEGKSFASRYALQKLPFYHFGENVAKTARFDRISEGFIKTVNGYTFKDGVVPSNYLLKRDKGKRHITIMIDPFFGGMGDIMGLLHENKDRAAISIRPLLYQEPAASQPGTLDQFRNEEALRWLILESISDTLFGKYIDAYVKQPGSSNWLRLCRDAGISPETIENKMTTSAALLDGHWKDMAPFSVKEPVAIIIDNAEIAVPGGVREFRAILQKLTHKRNQ